jgi:perosamine synthetase
MSDIQCALGRSQLARLPAFIKRGQEIFDWYAEEFFDFKDHVLIPTIQKNVTVSWFVYVIRLHDRYSRNDRDSLISFLKNEGIGCNAYFPSIHLQSFYRDTFGYERGAFPISESISDRTIALPFFTEISRVEVRRVCNTLREGVIKCFPK